MGLVIKDYQSTEKEIDEAIPETYRSTIRKIWPILLLSGLVNVVAWEQGDISPAFWRSGIHCPIPQPVDGACPTGAYPSASGTACLPVSRHDPGWSGSRWCMNRDYVIMDASAKSGSIGPYIGIFGIFGTTFFGMSLIDQVGKKFCMVFGLTTGCLVIVMHFILTWLGFTPAAIRTLCIVQCVAALTNIYNLAATAMVAEQIKNDEASRGMAFSMFNVALNASTLLSFAIGYIFLRQDLDEYRGFYTIATVVSVSMPIMAGILLPHSRAALHGAAEKAGLMPALDAAVDLEGEKENDRLDGNSSFTGWRGCRTIMVRTFVPPIRSMLSDTWLTMMLGLGFFEAMVFQGLINIAGSSFSMRVVGFNQATASLSGVIQPAFMMLGGILCSHLLAKKYANVYVLYYATSFVAAAGYFMISLCGVFPSQGAVLYCLGWGLIVGTAWGISQPAFITISVIRMDPRYRGSLFAIQAFSGGLGSTLGGYLSMTVITPRTSPHGWSSGAVFWGGAAILAVSNTIKVIVHVFKIFPEEQSAAASQIKA